MHRIAATPGGWNPDAEGVILIEQNPASIVVLTAADTDIQTLAASVAHLPAEFPTMRAVNLLQLQQQLSIDQYADTILSQAKVIILRLLGGRSYWSYGLEVIKDIAIETGASLFILPGDDRLDPELMSHSTVAFNDSHQLWCYLTEGGVENWINALKFISDLCFNSTFDPPKPKPIPNVGLYPCKPLLNRSKLNLYKVGLLFYRSHYLAGNLQPIDSLCQALEHHHLEPIPVFVSSLRESSIQEELLSFLQPAHAKPVELLLNTTSFSLAKLNLESNSEDNLELWKKLDIPVLQVILSGGSIEDWRSRFQGLMPRDVAMNVALPEVDGRIITRAVSFKSVSNWNPQLETDVVVYQSASDRIAFVTELAANWIRLKNTPIPQRKIALILANYPHRDGRIANGVGLDTPASCVAILNALKSAGYQIDSLPTTGDELINRLTAGVTNDIEGNHLRSSDQTLSTQDYDKYFKTLPEEVQSAIEKRWGNLENSTNFTFFPIPGIQLGNVFVGIQPSRGYDLDPSLNYHAPDLEPTPQYLAYYYWLKAQFKALAIVHIGKHGNLEWLPGKSLALSATCYPEIVLGTLPNFYPFIVNDPGEGSQAKRRAHAVILDHLTPPLTRAELYGDLEKLETLIDEYYEAQTLDPSRLKIISDRITQLVRQTQLDRDLGISAIDANSLPEFLTRADGYLCELKEAQIRDGLHIFGQCPQGTQLRDLILAIARSPSFNRLGLTTAIAQDLSLDFNPLTANLGQSFELPQLPIFMPKTLCASLQRSRTLGDAVEAIETYAAQCIDTLLTPLPPLKRGDQGGIKRGEGGDQMPATQKQLLWIQSVLLPRLQQTPQEIANLLKGLDGKYVPSGAAGAPTRGRPEVLPTGRNFYSVDIRAIPTETAWDVGRKAAEVLIERYTQENGEYPKNLAISIWGTSTMRTGGDDIAQVLALLGVRPLWDGSSRRVVGYEILSPSVLERPRVDVTVRISGFFRDSFPNLINLLYNAINEVSSLNEASEINPLAAQVSSEQSFWLEQGLTKEQAKQRSGYRIFGSKPGAYGAGLQGLIDAQNWKDDADLAQAYLNWSSYAYDNLAQGIAVPEVFKKRLSELQIVLHNQDNREHDLLDSDDYYQFQGGLTVAVRALTGKNPTVYLGDNSVPANPKVRLLTEEIARVYRSRVVNPKWIAGVMRHGYKGAFEMAATVDYLFAYDATANCVEDFMYQGVAEAYIFEEKVQQFVEQKNPWALRDMAERLLEANQRGLWTQVDAETIEKLRTIVHQAEGAIEERG